jgi:hypothetical protein
VRTGGIQAGAEAEYYRGHMRVNAGIEAKYKEDSVGKKG